MIEELHVDETISELNKKLIKNKSSLSSNKIKDSVNLNTNIMDKKIDVKGTKTESRLDKYPEKINVNKVSSINNKKGFLFKQTLKAFMSFILIILMLFMIIITLFEVSLFFLIIIKYFRQQLTKILYLNQFHLSNFSRTIIIDLFEIQYWIHIIKLFV